MTPAEALADLRRRGIGLVVDGETLRARAARGVLTEDAAALIRGHKPALLDLLRAERDSEVEAKRVASAAWAREMAAERHLRSGWFGTTRCRACGLERNQQVEACPRCAPSPSLPAGCRARMVCSVLGACANACVDASHLAGLVADIPLEEAS